MSDQPRKLIKVSTEKWHDWHIVSIEGAFVLRELNEIRSVFESIEKEPMPHVALDFSKVIYMDSSAITVMINFQNRLHDARGKLVIYDGNEDVQSILSIASLDKVIDVFETRSDFEDSFQ